MDLHINAETMKQAVHETFIGAGIGSFGSNSINYFSPAAKIAVSGGIFFGVVFSLARIIDMAVIKLIRTILSKVTSSGESNTSLELAVSVVCYAVRGALAFGLTSLMFASFTVAHAIMLTAVIGAVDLISHFMLNQTWMFVKQA